MIQQVLNSDFLKFMILEILNFHPNDIDTVKHLYFAVILFWCYSGWVVTWFLFGYTVRMFSKTT